MNIVFGILKYVFDAAIILFVVYVVMLIRKRVD